MLVHRRTCERRGAGKYPFILADIKEIESSRLRRLRIGMNERQGIEGPSGASFETRNFASTVGIANHQFAIHLAKFRLKAGYNEFPIIRKRDAPDELIVALDHPQNRARYEIAQLD